MTTSLEAFVRGVTLTLMALSFAALVWVIAVLVAGCGAFVGPATQPRDETVTCSDGTRCPARHRCTQHGCVYDPAPWPYGAGHDGGKP